MGDTNMAAFQVIDEKGVRGTLDLSVVPPQGSESKLVLVRFDDGSQVFADASTFVEREEGVFSFPGSFGELFTQNQSSKYGSTEFGDSGQIVIPLLAEQLNIARQKVLTGGVRVHKTVSERTETVDEPTLREEMEIQRVAVNSFITEPPAIRYEGDVMVVPLMEEVLVVEKKLVLREEIRITKRRDTLRNPQQYVVRREEATLEQIKPDAGGESLKALHAPVDEQKGGEQVFADMETLELNQKKEK
ncbi:MAG: YsnF/AvaK domain-containing protein [Acidobacteriota bacterium]|nr:YsnF/AvaK domain-containing protein [Acidobacteriota bacterium]